MRVTSEIGPLKKVLLHRPGSELEHILPAYMEDLLFDEIPWLERAREEHDEFAGALTEAGAKVYYIEELVADIMQDGEIKKRLIEEHLRLQYCRPIPTGWWRNTCSACPMPRRWNS